jgi:DNA polymerase-3 subunit delta
MGVLKHERLEAFLRTPDRAIRAFLVYGANAGRVREAARSIVVAFAGSEDDPFAITRLAEEDIAADPGRLADEVNSIALSGGTRTVWVRGAGDAVLKALPPLLSGSGGVVVAEAGALAKTSALRRFCEGAREALAVACYDDEARDLQSLIEETLRRERLGIESDALELLLVRLGPERAQANSELEKLVTYCHGAAVVAREDVEAVCGDGGAATFDRLADAVMGGNAELAARAVDELSEAGLPASSLLSALANHIARLKSLHQAAGTEGFQAAVRAARPQIYFKRQPAIVQQLRAWSPQKLDRAAASLYDAARQTRRWPQLDGAIAERALLSLAHAARRARS